MASLYFLLINDVLIEALQIPGFEKYLKLGHCSVSWKLQSSWKVYTATAVRAAGPRHRLTSYNQLARPTAHECSIILGQPAANFG